MKNKWLVPIIVGTSLSLCLSVNIAFADVAWHPKEKVELKVWSPSSPVFDKMMTEDIIPRFQKVYPKIKIDYQVFPFSELLTKSIAAIAGKRGADLNWVNLQWYGPFVEHELAWPIPETIIDDEYMKENYVGGIDIKARGKRYLVPTGVMGNVVFYNKTLFAKAGITPQDVGRTWKQAVGAFQKLTQWEGDRLAQAGLTVDGGVGQFRFVELVYQQGVGMFSEDGKRCHLNIPEVRKALQFILDLYDEYKVTSRVLLPSLEAFGANKTAAIIEWTWLPGFLKANYPNLNWGVLTMPTFDGDGPYGRCNLVDSAYVVTKLAQGERLKAAWEYWKFLFKNDENVEKICKFKGIIPVLKSLIDAPWIEERKDLSVLRKQITDPAGGHIFPGAYPKKWIDVTKGIFEEVVFEGKDIEKTLKKYEEIYNQHLAEHNYPYTPEA